MSKKCSVLNGEQESKPAGEGADPETTSTSDSPVDSGRPVESTREPHPNVALVDRVSSLPPSLLTVELCLYTLTRGFEMCRFMTSLSRHQAPISVQQRNAFVALQLDDFERAAVWARESYVEHLAEILRAGVSEPPLERWCGRFSGDPCDVTLSWASHVLQALLFAIGTNDGVLPGEFADAQAMFHATQRIHDDAVVPKAHAALLALKCLKPLEGELPLSAIAPRIESSVLSRAVSGLVPCSTADLGSLRNRLQRLSVWLDGESDRLASVVRRWPDAIDHSVDKEEQPDLVTTSVAIDEFHLSRSTIGRAIGDGRLTDYRSRDAPANAPRLLDRRDLERHFVRRT